MLYTCTPSALCIVYLYNFHISLFTDKIVFYDGRQERSLCGSQENVSLRQSRVVVPGGSDPQESEEEIQLPESW